MLLLAQFDITQRVMQAMLATCMHLPATPASCKRMLHHHIAMSVVRWLYSAGPHNLCMSGLRCLLRPGQHHADQHQADGAYLPDVSVREGLPPRGTWQAQYHHAEQCRTAAGDGAVLEHLDLRCYVMFIALV